MFFNESKYKYRLSTLKESQSLQNNEFNNSLQHKSIDYLSRKVDLVEEEKNTARSSHTKELVYKIHKEIEENDRSFITDLPNLYQDKKHKIKRLLAASIFKTQARLKPIKRYRYPKPGQTWLTATQKRS